MTVDGIFNALVFDEETLRVLNLFDITRERVPLLIRLSCVILKTLRVWVLDRCTFPHTPSQII